MTRSFAMLLLLLSARPAEGLIGEKPPVKPEECRLVRVRRHLPARCNMRDGCDSCKNAECAKRRCGPRRKSAVEPQ